MLEDQLNKLIGALNELDKSSGFAQKYGPYFFAIALLVVAPFVCRVIFAGSLAAKNEAVRKRAYEDFRFYLRATVVTGTFCVLVGVGWWLFDSYRESTRTNARVTELSQQLDKLNTLVKNMNFTAYGVITSGLNPDDNFYVTLAGPLTVFFANFQQT